MTKKQTKLMIGVEYFNIYNDSGDDDNHSTTELFETIAEAYDFASKVRFISAYIADFNTDYIFKEDGQWNYDDNANLFNRLEEIKFNDLIKFKE